MVSLEERSNYLSYVSGKPKLQAFYDFTKRRKLVIPPKDSLSTIDEVYYNSLAAVIDSDKGKFLKYYKVINKRQPSDCTTSPFVNDDFLIFSLLIAIKSFGIDKRWITDILQIRHRNELTITFLNILNDNFLSTSNIQELVITFLSAYDNSKIPPESLKNTYYSLANSTKVFENNNDIIVLSSIRAFDMIIEITQPMKGGELEFYQKFEIKFLKRIRILAIILYNLFLLLLLYSTVQIVDQLPTDIKNQLGQYNLIIGILGAGLLGSNFIQSFRRKFTDLVSGMLGYNTQIIRNIRSN